MTDPSMDPQQQPEPGLLGDAVPSIQATISWAPNGVTISLPDVDNAQPTGVTWDNTGATAETNGTYAGTGNTPTNNALTAVYATATYKNRSINRGTTPVTLTKV